jgi:hypothetical protein
VAIGLVLMVYPYFIYNSWLLWGIGLGLLGIRMQPLLGV